MGKRQPADPLELLKEEMANDEETFIRVNAMHRAPLVAAVLGPERVASQLIPYLNTLLNEIDEVLYALAAVYGELHKYIGANSILLLQPLEQLVSIEETVVREQAVKSIIEISLVLTPDEVSNLLAPMVLRLAQSEKFSSRVSSVQLVSAAYPGAGTHKEKLRQKFFELSIEDSPILRRTIAMQYKEYCRVVEKEVLIAELIPEFRKLSQDDQDQVRILSLDSLISIANILTKEENRLHTLPIAIASGEDKSWKIRIHFAKNFPQLVDAFGIEITETSLIQTFAQLLRDNEADVKTAALNSLTEKLPSLSNDKVQTLIFPGVAALTEDTSVNAYVRMSMADVIATMAPLSGVSFTISKLLPIAFDLINDDNPEVKMHVLNNLGKVAKVASVNMLTPQFIAILENLSKESPNWRVREAVLQLILELTQELGAEIFTQSLENIFFNFLTDIVQAVREAGAKKASLICEILGKSWCTSSLLPRLREAYTQGASYQHRITIIHILPILPLSLDQIEPILSQALTDRVPNVRFSACKVLAALRHSIEAGELQRLVSPLLGDSDGDVKYYAQQAMNQL